MLNDSEFFPPKDRINYETLTQESWSEYYNLIGSNFWDTAAIIKEERDKEMPKAYAAKMEKVVSKSQKQTIFDKSKARGGTWGNLRL